MAINIKFEMEGGGNLVRAFETMDRKISNFKPFMVDAVDEIEKGANDNFKSEGGELATGSWSDLSSRTKIARERRWGYYKRSPSNPRTLRRTGNLQDKTTKKTSKSEGSYSFDMPYAKYHQTGKGRMKRPLFQFTPKVNAEISRHMQKFLREIKESVGF